MNDRANRAARLSQHSARAEYAMRCALLVCRDDTSVASTVRALLDGKGRTEHTDRLWAKHLRGWIAECQERGIDLPRGEER